MARATCTAEELAERLGVSTWAIYQSVKDNSCPIEPIRVGRRLVWPKAPVDRLLGLQSEAS
jgi:predicted DNA-binding transcriptional regulator AlpA